MSRKTHFIVIAALLGALVVGVASPPAMATVLSGTVSSPVSVADQIIMNSVTSTASISTSTATNPGISVNGNTSIGADLLSTNNAFIIFNSGHNVVQTAGTVLVTPFRHLEFVGGQYTLNGGSMKPGTWFNVSSTNSVFTQNGGSILGNGTSVNFDDPTGGGGVDVGGASTITPVAGQIATMQLNGGTLSTANMLVGRVNNGTIANPANHAVGVVVQEAGSTVTIKGSTQGWLNNDNDAFGIYSFVISQFAKGTTVGVTPAESSYTLKGGSLMVTAANTKVYQWGKLAGYGTITTTSARTLNNSGKVVADGFGVDRTFDLSQYGTIANNTENGTERNTAGWYAQNHGKLTLPGLAVTAGASTINWGEAAADTNIDLISSVRLSFTGASAGTLSGSLLATNRADVAGGLINAVGVWQFSSPTFSSVSMVFRYDDVLANANEPSLKLFQDIGGIWTLVPSTLDQSNNLLTVTGLTSLSSFAIATGVPEPTSLLLAGAFAFGLLRRTRRGA